jgi:protoporphyrinogen oxidase
MAVIVLGGGISGLAAAQILQQQGRDFLLLERCPTLGGLTRTVEVGEFCFDYTGHFLHLSRYRTPEDIPYANLKNHEWVQVSRRSCCFVADRLITAPIQYNLAELPPTVFKQCVESYNARPKLTSSNGATFRDYVVSGFGQALADLFLIPQNEKTMAISLDRLTKDAVRRFFPSPNDNLVRMGMNAATAPSVKSYNSTFWYPKNGGIGRLVHGLRTGITNCAVAQDVTSINLRDRLVRTRTQSTYAWDMIFSSIPLKSLCEMTGDAELVSASAELSYSSTISFDIGLKASLRPDFENIHWIYIPDRKIPFYRVGFFSNIGEGMCTAGHQAMYVEVGLPSEQLARTDLVHDLQPRVIRSLEDLGWLDRRDIICVAMHIISPAYVHHTPQRDRALTSILSRLREYSVFPIGRYGLWDYTSMEDSMESARLAVLEHS